MEVKVNARYYYHYPYNYRYYKTDKMDNYIIPDT